MLKERRELILNILNQRGYMTVEGLAGSLYVSVATIRRDLSVLEKEGIVRRTYGGVTLNSSCSSLESTEFRSRMQKEEKRKIAGLASTLISEGDTVFLDSGSTCLNLTYELTSIPGLLILTNGLLNVHSLSRYDNIRIEIPGGIYDIAHACIVGDQTADYISSRYARLSFVSCSGIDASRGFSVVYNKDLSVKKAYCRHAEKTVLLVDSSKFNINKYYKVLDYCDIDVLICDKEPPGDIMDSCAKHHVDVICD